jgi:hypothetical protein
MKLISRRMGEEPSAEGQWHVVRTRGADPAIAAIGCEKAGWEVYLPTELIRVGSRWGRGNRLRPGGVMWQPVFPGSLFVRFDPGRDLRRLLEIAGIDGEVRVAGKLTPIAEDTVKAFRAAERRGLFDAAAGCRVPDEDGPPPDVRFASLMARVKRARLEEEDGAADGAAGAAIESPVSKNPSEMRRCRH